ncbi:MAG: hypothetical protein EHM89_14400 [Acidobacteria bacterium]|nr:MAG: hypothetical protein EHM89_14400 [Acidobacteriota bacterium]
MLIEPALSSARQSTFFCSDCTEATTTLALTYTFALEGFEDDWHLGPTSSPHVRASGHHITIEATRLNYVTCDPALVRVRSSRCLWLWACATRPSDACKKEAEQRARLRATPLVPKAWIDLPMAPLVARQLRNKAVLVNRSPDGFDEIRVGCIVEQAQRVHVLEDLGFTRSTWEDASTSYGYHFTFEPGQQVDGMLRFARSNDGLGARVCGDGTRVAVVSTWLRGKVVWSAEGTRWPR